MLKSKILSCTVSGLYCSILLLTILIEVYTLFPGLLPYFYVSIFWMIAGLVIGNFLKARLSYLSPISVTGLSLLMFSIALLLPGLWLPLLLPHLTSLLHGLSISTSLPSMLCIYILLSPLSLPFIPPGFITRVDGRKDGGLFLLSLSLSFFLLNNISRLQAFDTVVQLINYLPPLLFIPLFLQGLWQKGEGKTENKDNSPIKIIATIQGFFYSFLLIFILRLSTLLSGPSPETLHNGLSLLLFIVSISMIIQPRDSRASIPHYIIALSLLFTLPFFYLIVSPNHSPLLSIPHLFPYPLSSTNSLLLLTLLSLPVIPASLTLADTPLHQWILSGILISLISMDLWNIPLMNSYTLYIIASGLFLTSILSKIFLQERSLNLLKLSIILLPPFILILLSLSIPLKLDSRFISSGLYSSSTSFDPNAFRKELLKMDITFKKESPFSMDSIRSTSGNKELTRFGLTTGVEGKREINRIFSSLLPLVIHGKPSRVLLYGISDGKVLEIFSSITFDSLLLVEPSSSTLETVETFSGIDIEKEVFPLITLVNRPLLFSMGKQKSGGYDLIVLPMIYPKLNFEGGIFLEKNLEHLKRNLKGDGILSLSFNLDFIPIEELKTYIRTFISVFHTAFLFSSPSGSNEVNLLGFKKEGDISLKRMGKAFDIPVVKKLLRTIGIEEPVEFLEFFLMNNRGMERFVHGSPLLSNPARLFKTLYNGPVEYRNISGIAEFVDFIQRPQDNVVDLPEDPHEREMVMQKILLLTEGRGLFFDLLMTAKKGDFERLHHGVKRFLKLRPEREEGLDTLTAPYLSKAKRLMDGGLLNQAITYFAIVLMINPEDVEALVGMGDIHFEKGFYRKAENYFRKAIEYRKSAEIYHRLASSLYKQKKLDEAIESVKEAINLAPSSYIYKTNAGSLFLEKGDIARALEYFHSATIIEPRNSKALAGIAEAHFRRKEYNLARSYIQRAIEIEDKTDFHFILGKIYFETGNLSRAKGEFIKVILSEPEFVEARGALGLIFAKEGNFEKAESEWREVLRLEPDNRAAKENLKRMKEHKDLLEKASRNK